LYTRVLGIEKKEKQKEEERENYKAKRGKKHNNCLLDVLRVHFCGRRHDSRPDFSYTTKKK
jgi:hypothetical protein